MNNVFIISIIILCIYLVIVYKEYTKNHKNKKKDIPNECKLQQCEDCMYKDYCYLDDEDIEQEKD